MVEPNPVSILAGLVVLSLCVLVAQCFTRFGTVSFRGQRLGYVDGLRGLLALGVFLHHYVITYYFHLTGKWTVPPSQFYTLIGQVGASLFFMVTGFIFWYKLSTQRGHVSWFQLYISRVFRLVPLYWFVVAIVFFIVISDGGPTLKVSVASLFKQFVLWLSFAGTPDINAYKGTSLIVASVTWTLKYEWAFYLSLPFLAAIVRLKERFPVALWFVAAFLLTVGIRPFSIPYLHLNTGFCIFFLAGAISASAYQTETCRTLARRRGFAFLSLLALILVFLLFDTAYGPEQTLLMLIFFGPIALGNSIFGLLNRPALVLLGEISYSIYLLHGLLLYATFSLCFPWFMKQSLGQFELFGAMSAISVLLVSLSWLTFSFLEMPFIKIGRSVTHRILESQIQILAPRVSRASVIQNTDIHRQNSSMTTQIIQIIQTLPFPKGKDFAVSFVDDTDMSTRENTEPVYDLLSSLNIKGTKTVWVNRQKRTSSFRREGEKEIDLDINSGSTLEDKEYLDFVLNLRRKGFEIALHNASAGNSYREEIVEGVEKFKAIFGEYPKINVFHAKNIENLYAGRHKLDFWPLRFLEKITNNSDYMGHIENSPYFWGDITRDKIKYIRLPFHTITEINTLKINPNMPFHDPKRPFVNYWFSSSDGSDCRRFNKLLSPDNIKKLERENGVCLIYTHFAKGFVEKKNDTYELNHQFIEAVTNLSKSTNAWFPTASELLDRFLAFKTLSVKLTGYDLFLINAGDTNFKSLTLKLAPGIVLRDQDKELISSDDGKIVIGNIPPKTTLVLKSNIKDNLTIKDISSNNAYRSERMKIELYNYYGLLKQAIRLNLLGHERY